MSAETIPAEVVRTLTHETVCGYKVAAYRETHPEHGVAYGHTYSEHWSTPNSRHPSVTVERLFTEAQLRDALTNRSTRPAEPAAPVAEAGDGEVYLADACKPWEFSTGPMPAYDSPLHQVFVAGMLYTEQLLANHLGVKRYEAGDGSEDFDNDATMSLVNILTEAGLWDKDEWRSTLEAERARADAAEQRAADALARAEKGEDWQPIRTAPQKESLCGILFATKSHVGGVVQVWWSEPRRAFEDMEGDTYLDAFAWRPLPAPPRDLSQGGQHG